MKTKNSGRGEPVESMCLVAGTGSSVLDPFPSVVVASLRAVDHRCCTPLPCGVVVVETVALNPLVQGVTHTHTPCHTSSPHFHLFPRPPPWRRPNGSRSTRPDCSESKAAAPDTPRPRRDCSGEEQLGFADGKWGGLEVVDSPLDFPTVSTLLTLCYLKGLLGGPGLGVW